MGKHKKHYYMSDDELDYLEEESEDEREEVRVTTENVTNTCGLRNFERICWFNSAIQCLAGTPAFLEELIKIRESNQSTQILPGGKLQTNGLEKDIPPLNIKFESSGPLTTELTKTLCYLKKTTDKVWNPEELLAVVGVELVQFTVGEEQDSHEFIRSLLEALKEENKLRIQTAISNSFSSNEDDLENEKLIRKFYFDQGLEMNLSPTEKLFGGSLQNVLRCTECGNENCRKEVFFDFSLPIPIPDVGPAENSDKQHIEKKFNERKKGNKKQKSNVIVQVPKKEIQCSLEKCLNQFFCAELLTDDNKPVCEECTKRSSSDGEIRTSTSFQPKISNPPKILIINLKRFQYLNGCLEKIKQYVSFPVRLNIAKYCTQDYLDKNGNKAEMYSLYAVEEHCMQGNDDHYISFRYDDDRKDEIADDNNSPMKRQWVYANDADVRYVSIGEVLKSQAYILFYKKIDM